MSSVPIMVRFPRPLMATVGTVLEHDPTGRSFAQYVREALAEKAEADLALMRARQRSLDQ